MAKKRKHRAFNKMLSTIKEKIEVISVNKNIDANMTNEDKVKFLRKPRSKSSIAIDKDGDIICKSWGNYYIEGGEFDEETVMMINQYLEECNKPAAARDFSKFDVGKKIVTEKFNDMDLYRGKIDMKGFLQDVV